MPIKSKRVRQSACRWCYQEMPIDTLAREAAAIGLVGLDLVDPADWNVLSKHDLACTMTPSHGIVPFATSSAPATLPLYPARAVAPHARPSDTLLRRMSSQRVFV